MQWLVDVELALVDMWRAGQSGSLLVGMLHADQVKSAMGRHVAGWSGWVGIG